MGRLISGPMRNHEACAEDVEGGAIDGRGELDFKATDSTGGENREELQELVWRSGDGKMSIVFDDVRFGDRERVLGGSLCDTERVGMGDEPVEGCGVEEAVVVPEGQHRISFR